MLVDREELAWAAGIFEGEGCFMLGGNAKNIPGASINMNDADSLKRFYMAVSEIGRLKAPTPSQPRTWRWAIYGFEGTQALGAMLWYGLGLRRRTRLEEVLQGAHPVRASWAMRNPMTGKQRGHLL